MQWRLRLLAPLSLPPCSPLCCSARRRRLPPQSRRAKMLARHLACRCGAGVARSGCGGMLWRCVCVHV